MINMPELRGLVLVGGNSVRMGKPKAYLDFGQGPQWQVCQQTLLSVCTTASFSVSPQLEPPLPSSLPLIADVFCTPIGPLGGIMSAFNHEDSVSYFVLACDAPYFTAESARYLALQRNPHKKATVFVKNGQVEPLMAIYEPAIFLDLAQAWAAKNYCPRAILSALDIKRVDVPDETWLTNINHAHEFLLRESPQKMVRVHYYASLREHAVRTNEQVATSAHSVGELFLELKHRYGFLLDEQSMRFAQNDRLVKRDAKIHDHDEIVFIPPVSGG